MTEKLITGVQLEKRCDLIGKAHFNKLTGESVPTPHVHESGVAGGARLAESHEIPKRAAKRIEK
jgi:hypothetical protein